MPTEKLDMRLRLKCGQLYGARLIRDLKITRTIQNDEGEEDFMFAFGMDFEVEDVDANEVARMKVTYRTVKADITRWPSDSGCCGGACDSPVSRRFRYDSTKDSVADVYSEIWAGNAAALGESFIVKVAPKGRIIEFEGLDEMHRRMIDKVAGWDGEFLSVDARTLACLKEVTEHSIKVYYREDEMRNMLGDMIMAYPERPVGFGESWVGKVRIWGNQHEIDGTYTLKGNDDGVTVVDLAAERDLDEGPCPWVDGKEHNKDFRLAGSCNGSFEIDEASAWLIRSKLNMRFTGEVIEEADAKQVTEPILEEEVIIVGPME
jgi:hypothetical protein